MSIAGKRIEYINPELDWALSTAKSCRNVNRFKSLIKSLVIDAAPLSCSK